MPDRSHPAASRILLDQIDQMIEEKGDRPVVDTIGGRQKSPHHHRITFTADQEALLRQAAQKRGLHPAAGLRLSYIRLATLAFVAYDLGIDVFEVIGGEEFPFDDPKLAGYIENLARETRGKWGITGLEDHNAT